MLSAAQKADFGTKTMHDIVIRGGTILDGTGADAFTGDVAIDTGARPGRLVRAGR